MRTLLSIAALFTLYQPLFATTVKCPEQIKTNQSQQGTTAAWESFVDDTNAIYPLSHITFYAEHPKNHASLTPDQEHPKKNQLTWTFGNEAIWLACGYANTSIQLIQKLPDATKRCVVTYDNAITLVQKVECFKAKDEKGQ